MRRLLPIFLCLISATALGQPRLVVQTGHTDVVNSVAFSPDGNRVLTGGIDQTARIWDVESGKEILLLSDHDEFVMSAVFSPDGRFVATGSRDSKVNLFSATTGELVRKIPGHGWMIYAVAYMPDGSGVVSGDYDGSITLWSVPDGQQLRRFRTGDKVNTVAVGPDGESVLAGTENGSLILYSLASGQAMRVFEGHTGPVRTVAFSPDGSTVLSGSEDGSARLWSVASGEELLRLPKDGPVAPDWRGVANAVAFSGDGRRILTGHGDGTTRLWSVADGTELRRFAGHDGWVNSVAFSPDGSLVVTGGHDATARLWSIETGTQVLSFEGQVDTVLSLDVRSDGRELAAGSGGHDHMVSLWSLDGGGVVGDLPVDRGGIPAVQYSRDGSLIAAAGGNRVDVWDTRDGTRLGLGIGFDHDAKGIAFAPDDRRIFAGSFDRSARLVDLPSGEVADCCSDNRPANRRTPDHIMSVAWSPDGQYVVTGGRSEEYGENYAYLWQVSTGQRLRIFGPVESQVSSAAFSPDGRYLLASSHGSAWIWDVQTGETLRRLDHQGAFLTSAIWLPDGRHVVTGGRDRLVRVWDVDRGVEVRRFEGHTAQVNGIKALDDGKVIASASQDGTIRLWDNVDGGEICRLVAFGDGSWAVVDSSGRFDASNGGDVDGLHWVVDDEIVALSQLKERFYEPGLLAKVLGYNDEPLRDVTALAEAGVALHPKVVVTHAPDSADPVLRAVVENRGGGIGPVQVRINGKEITADARPPGSDPDDDSLTIELDLANHPYLRGNGRNTIDIVASNREQSLVGRGNTLDFDDDALVASGARQPPSIWALVVGVSKYRGATINLNFAHRDAASFANALEIAGSGLVDPDRVHVRLINGDPEPATRSNIIQAFDDIAARAVSSDILVLYLAGHGVTWGSSADADYYYLLQDATSLDIRDAAVRSQVAISSGELTALIKKIAALKQVLILDTCASGQLVTDLVKSRGVSAGQMRSLERMKDRTGMFVLAGSAADAPSYEASPYGQGLLTYSLLAGMRGAALRDGEFVDVDELFGFASDNVQRLADRLGGIQQPRVGIPNGGESFDIGRLQSADRARIKLASPRPIVISTNFQDERQMRDHLKLGQRIDSALRDAASAEDSGFVFFATRDFPDAYELTGRYTIDGGEISLSVRMFRADVEAGEFVVTGTASDLSSLETGVVQEMQSRLR